MSDRRLLISVGLLALIAVMSLDVINVRLTRAFAPKAQSGPNVRAWKPGSTHEVDITLVTQDMSRLHCADDREFEGARCEYTEKKRRRQRDPGAPLDDNRQNVIQPYRTAIGNHLVLVAGMWNTPALAMRYHQEPPRSRTTKKLKRFVARCQLKFVGSMKNVLLRWNPSAKWYTEKYAPVAIAQSCEIPEGEGL